MFTRVAELAFIIAGATLGLLGVVGLTYVMVCYATSLKSLGVPFLALAAPRELGSAYGALVAPPWDARNRPLNLRPKDAVRQPEEPRLWDEGQILEPSSLAAEIQVKPGARPDQGKGGKADAAGEQGKAGTSKEGAGKGRRKR